MKRKLLALLLCTVIIFNNALPVLADGLEGEQTEHICGENCAEHPTETITAAPTEAPTTAAPETEAPTSESTETSENTTASEDTSVDTTAAPAEEPCADCTEEAKCEKHAAEIIVCEICKTEPCVCPVVATCDICGVEYTVVEGEEHTCAPVCSCGTETEEHAVECPLYVAPVVENCEICGEALAEGHECAMCECGKLANHEDACQICLCGAVDADTHAENCMNIMMPKCEICEGAHTTDKCPENCQACLEVEGAEHTCGKIFCEICLEEMFEDIEHIHCEECEELLVEGECPICDACNCGAEEGEPHADFCINFRANLGTAYVENTEAAPLLDPVEGEVASVWSLRPTTFAATKAAGDPVKSNDVVTTKTVTMTGNNQYKLTLETYVTGATTTTTVTEDIPTDIVLVLDQSGSMSSDFGTSYTNYTEYTNRTNSTYYGLSNLWYKDGDKYVAVNVEREWVQSSGQQYTYTDVSNYTNGTLYGNSYRNNLYYKTDSGNYEKVSVSREWSNSNNRYVYTYTLPDETITRIGQSTSVNIENLYYRQQNNNNNYIRRYTYTYTKLDGTVVTFTSDGENTTTTNNGETVTFWSGTGGTTISRSTALKNAVTTFVNSVNEKAKGEDKAYGGDDDVNHRIAVVGFASAGLSGSYYVNTELFIGATQHGYTSADDYYSTAFQSMDTEEGYNNVIASKNALAADGGTYVDLGIEMANGIFEENPIESGTRRNRVVVVFTDGAPGYNGTWNDRNYGQSGDAQAVANEALDNAHDTKNDYGATIYTVGIFSGANATTPMPNNADNSNKFMHYLSSNFKNAQSMSSAGTATYPSTGSYYLSAANADSLNNIFQQISNQIQNGGASVTLDSSTVIKDVITPYFTLPAGADTSSIKVYTEDYTAENTFENRQNATGVTVTIDGKTIDTTGFDFSTNWVGTEKTNGVVTGYRGKKLIIEIPIVAEPEFLGGNNVPTNDGTSGVYSGDTVMENFDVPVANVTIPSISVDVVDKNVYYSNDLSAGNMTNGMSATANGVNLLGNLDWRDDYVIVSTTDPSAFTDLKADTNYTVTVSINPEDTENVEGNTMDVVTGKSGSDTANVYVYRPVLTIADSTIYLGQQPGTDYAENTKTITKWMHGATEAANMIGTVPTSFTYGFDTAIAKFDDCTNVNGWITTVNGVEFTATDAEKVPFTVHVMTPTVTWADTERYYGETFPTSFTPVSTTWACKDGETTATNGTTAPTIDYTFSTTENGYMPNATVPVTVTAKIGDKTITPAYEWQKCNETETKTEGQFLVHPLFCSLEITKSGWETIDPNESFIFTLNGDNKTYPIKDFKVIVHGNGTVQVNGLPVGNYTVTEDENWSWRYDLTGANSVELTDGIVKTITATNNRVEALWLDFATWCKNLFTGDSIKQTKSN